MWKGIRLPFLFATIASSAFGSLVYDSSVIIDANAGGFGNIPRLLSISNSGSAQAGSDNLTNFYSACVGINSSGGVYGDCLGTDASIMGNQVIVPNSNNISPPPDLSQKNNILLLSSIGVNTPDDIRVVFNAIENQPNDGQVTLNDVTLKFYDADGNLVASIDGDQDFSLSLSGNGNYGFAFHIDGDQQLLLTQALGADIGSYRIALEAAVSNASGGDESFFLVNRNPDQNEPGTVPEPSTMGIMGGGLVALGLAGRRFRK